MDSGFCVVEGLLEMKRLGVYGSTIVKKRRYYPRYIDGEEIKEYMDLKGVGEADAMLGSLRGDSFYVFALKDADYTMIMLSTYGTLEEAEDGETKQRVTNSDGKHKAIIFNYPETFRNH